MWNQLHWTADNGTSVTDLNGVYVLEPSNSVCSVMMNPVAWLVYLNLSTQLTWLTFHQSDSSSFYYSWVQKHQKPFDYFSPSRAAPIKHHTTVTDPCDDSHGLILAWKYGGRPTNNLLSTPAHYGNNYCRNQCAKLQTDTEALLSERERRRPPSPLSGLSASFGAWPLCPLNPSALFPVTNTFLSPLSGCGGQAV